MKTILMFALTLMSLNGFNAAAAEDPKFGKSLCNWISNHMEYPQEAINQREQGTVYVAFTILEGKIVAEVVEGVSPTLDSAALSVVNNIPVSDLASEEPKSYILPIKFALK